MPIAANLNSAGVLVPPEGFPVRLLAARHTTLEGIISQWVASVSATVKTEKGTANAYMALFTMPTTSGGQDGAEVTGTRVTVAGLTTVAQTLTVTVPKTVAPAAYTVRLCVDSITGANADTISRDGSTATAYEPTIPVAVVVTSMTVS